MNIFDRHSFHIPVLGIGYTLDTPVKVAPYGISSVISLVDDTLIEQMREFYSQKFDLPFQAITEKVEDFRAKRITSYLNMVDEIVTSKFDDLKKSALETGSELEKYVSMLPDLSSIKEKFNLAQKSRQLKEELQHWVQDHLPVGSIDVNIMTKVDKDNYSKGEKLPTEYNDAHAALRGYANSDLCSSIVLSAGMNPRLYSYIEHFDDFYPNANGEIKKKIILKVSDYRSALIQGKFLAKKGIWVSEYRIESGLNCGGHAFASDGHMMGPILEEFKEKRQELFNQVFEILVKVLEEKDRIVPNQLDLQVSAQGGVGTNEEHQFLLDYYKVDSVGWGTPFLLVPEATNVDEDTLKMMEKAKEDDLFLSDISPLGVPFNSLKGNTKDIERLKWISEGRPGSLCPKRYVALDTEFSERGLCTASRQYQALKIKQLDEENLSPEEYKRRFDKIVIKSCTCVGLGTPALLVNNLPTNAEGEGVAACPGPNIAYFSKRMSLSEMVSHIYGRTNVIERDDRPNMFVNELNIYIDYLKNKIEEAKISMTTKQKKYLQSMVSNLKESNCYYETMFKNLKDKFSTTKSKIMSDLEDIKDTLNRLNVEIETL